MRGCGFVAAEASLQRLDLASVKGMALASIVQSIHSFHAQPRRQCHSVFHCDALEDGEVANYRLGMEHARHVDSSHHPAQGVKRTVECRALEVD